MAFKKDSTGILIVLGLVSMVGVSALIMAATSDTRVVDAAMKGDIAAVRTLLKQGADVNTAQGDGMTALHWAAMKDQVEMAQMLLYAGANVHAVSRIGNITPLSVAAKNGYADMTRTLLKAGADPKTRTADGITPLMLAATAGDADAVKALLEAGSDANARESIHKQTALMFAAAYNRADAIKVLMAHGADPKLATDVRQPPQRGGFRGAQPQPQPQNQPGQQPPANAPQRGRGQRQGNNDDEEPQITSLPMGGLTPLLYAARQGHIDAARALLDGGAPINEVSVADKTSPLMIAVINGHFDLAMFFLERGADPTLTTMAGATPLYGVVNIHWAPKAFYPEPSTKQEKTTHLQIIDALLRRGADPNARLSKELWYTEFAGRLNGTNAAGATAFWRAAQVGDVETMRLLISRGADPRIATVENVTPLLACSGSGFYGNDDRTVPAGRMPAVRYLVEQFGADVNAADTKGYTAIHNAASRGDNVMIQYLVSKGAKADAVSKNGQTTVDMANGPRQRIQPFPETVALLMSLGAKNSHKCVSC